MINHCGVLLGNSSSGMIEASYFNTSVINIGIRQAGRERGMNVIDVPRINIGSIYNAIVKGFQMQKKRHTKEYVYGNRNTSKKIIHYLEKIDLNKNLIQKQIFY